jgi:DNA-binding ferritin-like protein
MDYTADQYGKLIRLLEQAMAFADDLGDGTTGYLIERALDEARSRLFRLPSDG